jgi:hypothetical protein
MGDFGELLDIPSGTRRPASTENRADIDLPDPDGVSPLLVAIMNANWDLRRIKKVLQTQEAMRRVWIAEFVDTLAQEVRTGRLTFGGATHRECPKPADNARGSAP